MGDSLEILSRSKSSATRGDGSALFRCKPVRNSRGGSLRNCWLSGWRRRWFCTCSFMKWSSQTSAADMKRQCENLRTRQHLQPRNLRMGTLFTFSSSFAMDRSNSSSAMPSSQMRSPSLMSLKFSEGGKLSPGSSTRSNGEVVLLTLGCKRAS